MYCTILVILFHLVAGQSGHRETEKPQAFPVRLCGPAGLDSLEASDFRLQTSDFRFGAGVWGMMLTSFLLLESQ